MSVVDLTGALLTADEAARLQVGVNVLTRQGDWNHDGAGNMRVAPQDWVAQTGSCPTCEGNRSRYRHLRHVACPDCRDGRRIVPLYTEGGCAECDWRGLVLAGRAAVVSIEPDDGGNFRITLDVVELA